MAVSLKILNKELNVKHSMKITKRVRSYVIKL